MMFNDRKLESLYPIGMSVLVFIISIATLPKFKLGIGQDVINTVIGSYINFAAITMGFEGALLGILFSISESPLVDRLFKSRSKLQLKKYFMSCLFSGVASLGLSTIMYFIFLIQEITAFYNFKYLVTALWITSVVHYLLCNFRIVTISMDILFNKDAGKESSGEILDNDGTNKLEEKHKR